MSQVIASDQQGSGTASPSAPLCRLAVDDEQPAWYRATCLHSHSMTKSFTTSFTHSDSSYRTQTAFSRMEFLPVSQFDRQHALPARRCNNQMMHLRKAPHYSTRETLIANVCSVILCGSSLHACEAPGP